MRRLWCVIRALWRLARLGLHLVWGMIQVLRLRWVSAEKRAGIIARWLRRLPALAGVHVAYPEQTPPQCCLLVANHSSWLDIPVLGGMAERVVFLSKAQIRRWPVVGFLAQVAGTVFIQRGRGAGIAAQAIHDTLDINQRMLIFPEGTTTDGLKVRRFHSRLFQAAIDAQVPVQPVAVRYFDAENNRTTIAAYTNQTSLMRSLWSVLLAERLTVSVQLLTPVDAGVATSRDELAYSTQQAIAEQVNTED